MITGTLTRIGRITLWLVCWPLGLWRSLVHGQKRRQRKFERELKQH